jgi:glucokinase
MMRYVIGVEVHVKRVEVAIIDLQTNDLVSGTNVHTAINAMESAENLLECWTNTIKQSVALHGSEVEYLGLAIPGPFDYENGISWMKGLGKFDALYGLNIKEMLSERLGIPANRIRTANNSPCFLQGEMLQGAGRGGYSNVLGFVLSSGFGSARYYEGVATDADLWKVPFRSGIAADFFDIKWISGRYEDFTRHKCTDIKELTELAKTDDGIGQLVFGEYGENFSHFLAEYVKKYNSDLVIMGGHNDAWDLFIPHVKDRLGDQRIHVPIKSAELGDIAALIGAGYLWKSSFIY